MAEILGYAVWVDGAPQPTGSGIERVEHVSPGNWHIWFSFSVANAIELASIGHYQQAGWITAYGEPPLGTNAVSVVTGIYETGEAGDLAAVQADLTFQLLVVA